MPLKPMRPVREVSASGKWAERVLQHVAQHLSSDEKKLYPQSSRQERIFGGIRPVHRDCAGEIRVVDDSGSVVETIKPLRLRFGEMDQHVCGIHLVDENLGRKTWEVLRRSYCSLVIGICRKGCTERRSRDIANQVSWMVIESYRIPFNGVDRAQPAIRSFAPV